MRNVIQFPARNQVEVKCLRQTHTGIALYRFYDVNDGFRELTTVPDPTDVAVQVAHLNRLGIEVVVDDETHMALQGDGGTAA